MATLSVAATTIGAIALGTSSRNMIRRLDEPKATAAIANSRSRSERTGFHNRATLIHAVAAISTVVVIRPGSVSAASAAEYRRETQHGIDDPHQHRADDATAGVRESADKMPSAMAMTMATMPMESDTRPPIINRASTSRPSSSVPRM